MGLLDADELERWRGQAGRALATAQLAAAGGQEGWACFLCEQSAQLACKGLLHAIGAEAWGHDLLVLEERLATALGDGWPDRPLDEAARLTRHYIPTRYPDAHPSGDAGSHYRPEDARQARVDAEAVLAAVDRAWRALVTESAEAGDGA